MKPLNHRASLVNWCLAVFALVYLLFGSALAAPTDSPRPALLPGGAATEKTTDGDAFRQFNQAEMVFLAKVAEVRYGPVARSLPPIYSMEINFKDAKFLKGKQPEALTFGYRKRQMQRPEFPLGKPMLVAAYRDPNSRTPQISYLVDSSQELVKLAATAVALPLGWNIEQGKTVSPWAATKKAWPKTKGLDAELKCSKTGRPALLAGPEVHLSVEQVIPKEIVKYQNPYGDGQFKVTVTNTSKKLVTVPALLTDGKKILWPNSLVLIDRNQTRLLPGAAHPKTIQPATINPGESVSGVIDVLPVDGIQWPRGGSRVYLQFCLGEHSARNFFYYFSRRHDKLRDEALEKLTD